MGFEPFSAVFSATLDPGSPDKPSPLSCASSSGRSVV